MEETRVRRSKSSREGSKGVSSTAYNRISSQAATRTRRFVLFLLGFWCGALLMTALTAPASFRAADDILRTKPEAVAKVYEEMGPELTRTTLRAPVAASAEELMIDEDCPMCQMMADPEFGPSFWHLDASHMDLEDNWIFSLHPTRESWEAERREWEEMSRKYNEERAQREAETEWARGARIFDDRKIASENEADDDIPF